MIEIKNLTFHYGKRKPLFDDFSLNQKIGKIVGLLGKNGAGKSTLLKLVAGLLAPQQGALSVNGFTPFERKPDFLANVYMVPEEFSLPAMKISSYLKAITPLYPAFDAKKLHDIFEQFELKPNDRLHKLSHGQRKKFLIAFALASNCRLLILDEPTNGLDIPSKSLFRKVLVGSISDEQLVLISTHQVKDIDTVIDKIVVVDNGKMIFEQELAETGKSYLFETVTTTDDLTGVLYQEKAPVGYRIIRPANGGAETVVDMELLFNAIINQSIKQK